MIARVLNKIFYNPYREVGKKRDEVDVCSSTILTNNFKLDFRTSARAGKRAVIGGGNILSCSLIFESSEGRVEIGSKCFINAGTKLISRSSIIIGNYVTIAWGVTLYDHDSHSLEYQDRRADILQQLEDYSGGNLLGNKNWNTVNSEPIVVEDDVWIGMNATILKGVKVGRGAVIGAYAVVTKDVEPWTVVAGNPAKVVKKISGGC